MNFPKIQLQSTPARLDLKIQKPIQQIEQQPAELDLQQPAAILTMSTTKPKLLIDSTEARADVGLKSIGRVIEDLAAEAHQAVLEGTARRAEQGDELMRIENGDNPIQSQAKQAGSQPYSGLSIKSVPSYGSVKISFEPGSLDIKVQPQKVINNTTVHKPIINYTPGKVIVEVLQYASLKIDWII